MSADYFSRAIPDPYRILGLKLKPLSIGRYRLLSRFNCAFVSDKSEVPTMADLILGVLICSMRCDEFVEFAGSKSFEKEIAKWGRKVTREPLLKRIRRKPIDPPFLNPLEKIRLFYTYIKDASSVPAYFDETEGGMQSAAHWSHGLEVTLRSELGWLEEEVNESPLSKAIADYFKHAENKGAITLMHKEDEAEGEHNATLLEKAFPNGT